MRSLLVLAAAGALLGASGRAGAVVAVDDPLVAPATTTSADGRTVTDGRRTLTASSVRDLQAGQQVAVAGQGYDTAKGIYVALCVVPPQHVAPSPCGGGADREGQVGASQWVSSNPPPYAAGVTVPYGPGGSFSVTFTLLPEIAPGIDCRTVRCALVTRNDHLRSADRSQDLFLPVTFAAVPPPTTVPPGAPPAPVAPVPSGPGPTVPASAAPPPTVTLPPTTTTTIPPPPTTALADDSRSVTDGSRRLEVSATDVAVGDTLSVTGRRFDAAVGLYVSVCALGDADDGVGACASGSPEVTRWVSSDASAGGAASAMGADGSFLVELRVPDLLEDGTDCTATVCAVVARPDAAAPPGVAPLAVPLRVEASTSSTTGDPTVADPSAAPPEVATVSADGGGAGGGGDGGMPVVVGVLAVVAGGVGAALVARQRRSPAAAS